MLEDVKGKIRVYARVRPMLRFEADNGQRPALMAPDELTVAHAWKDEKKPREYPFDQVFTSDASQARTSWARRGQGGPERPCPHACLHTPLRATPRLPSARGQTGHT